MTTTHGGARRKVRATDRRGGAQIGAGRKKTIRVLKLAEPDALIIEAVTDLPLDAALLRIAASCAADPTGARATLAPLLAVEGWEGEVV